MCRRWNRGLQGICWVDASERELRKRELGGNVLRDSDVWNSLRSCIQKKSGIGGVGMASGCGGRALAEMQRSKKEKESCVAAVTCDGASGARLNLWTDHCVSPVDRTQSLESPHHVTPVWRPISAQGARSSHQIVAAGESVVRSAGCQCSKSDSTLWCQEAAACSEVYPYGHEGTTKTNTERQMLQGTMVKTNTDM